MRAAALIRKMLFIEDFLHTKGGHKVKYFFENFSRTVAVHQRTVRKQGLMRSRWFAGDCADIAETERPNPLLSFFRREVVIRKRGV
jgi:hypothetical protein